jgi:hypothetical protein
VHAANRTMAAASEVRTASPRVPSCRSPADGGRQGQHRRGRAADHCRARRTARSRAAPRRQCAPWRRRARRGRHHEPRPVRHRPRRHRSRTVPARRLLAGPGVRRLELRVGRRRRRRSSTSASATDTAARDGCRPPPTGSWPEANAGPLSASGVVPACASPTASRMFARTVGLAAAATAVASGLTPTTPWSPAGEVAPVRPAGPHRCPRVAGLRLSAR